MKKQFCNSVLLNVLIFTSLAFFLLSCSTNKWMVPSEYIGHWESDKNIITVPYKLNAQQHSQFISDSANININISDDKTVSGFIGRSAINSGKILKSWSFPGLRKTEYHIECYLTGKIFGKDPLEAKEVDIWLTLLNENGKIKADLRSGGSKIPMGLMLLEKMNK